MQNARKQGRNVSIKLFSIQPYLTYMHLPTLKTCSYIGCLQDVISYHNSNGDVTISILCGYCVGSGFWALQQHIAKCRAPLRHVHLALHEQLHVVPYTHNLLRK